MGAPIAPENAVKEKTDSGIKLTWDEAKDNIGIAYYRLEKDGKFLVRIDMCYGSEETSFIDAEGSLDSTYTITVFDAAGNCSETITIV